MRPECAVNEVLIVVRNATKSPGDCCSEYRCGSEPDCYLKKETYGGIRLNLKGRIRQGMFIARRCCLFFDIIVTVFD